MSLNPRKLITLLHEICPESGSRVQMVKQAMMKHTMMRKPRTRVAQANPRRGMRCWSMIGKTTPPTAPPLRTIPIADTRLLRNQ